MNIKSISTSILLTNNKDKKVLSIRSFSDDSGNSRSVEIENVLENKTIMHFLDSNIKSVKCVKSYIGDNKYRECIELKNSGNSSLNIISDDVNNYFKDLVNYIDENRCSMYEKHLFDLMCKYNFDEIFFRLSSNSRNSEISIIDTEGKKKLIYYVPYTKDNKGKKIVKQEDLDLIQNTINNYFGITGCKLNCTYEESSLGYLLGFYMFTDKSNIIIDDREIYYGLELYFNLVKKELEKEFLRQRDKDFKESQKNLQKSKLRVLKKEEDNKE